MLGSAVLDTAIGAVLVFAVTALLASGINEFIANFFQLRAKYLLGGLRRLLENPDALTKARADGKAVLTGVAQLALAAPLNAQGQITTANQSKDITKDVLTHASIQAAVEPASIFTKGSVRFPSYLSSAAFRTALLDTLLPDTVAPGASTDPLVQLADAVSNLPDSRAKDAILSFLKLADGKIANVEAAIENWYDDQMARVSGWYKRYTQLILFVIGVFAAVLLNIDTLQVAHTLWTDEPVRTAVASAATSGAICENATDAGTKRSCATDELASLKADGIPLGWRSNCSWLHEQNTCWTWDKSDPFAGDTVPLKIFGWLVTALAVSFGAPFWFDALSKLGSLRSAGAKPSDSVT